jgi:hypothetical protein
MEALLGCTFGKIGISPTVYERYLSIKSFHNYRKFEAVKKTNSRSYKKLLSKCTILTNLYKYLCKINPVFAAQIFEDFTQRGAHRFKALVGSPG